MERMLLLIRLLSSQFPDGRLDRLSRNPFRRFTTIAALMGMVLFSGTFTPVAAQTSQSQTAGSTVGPSKPDQQGKQSGANSPSDPLKPTAQTIQTPGKPDPVP